jgi:hypothetical protein
MDFAFIEQRCYGIPKRFLKEMSMEWSRYDWREEYPEKIKLADLDLPVSFPMSTGTKGNRNQTIIVEEL